MTIYDIAKACGVSIATVSRVLNNSDKVSEKTRQKVLAVIQQQNYSPNPFARGLGLDSMKMIGLLCTDVSDAFYAKAVALVEHELKQRGLDMMLVCTGNDLNEKKKYIQFLLKKHVDAIILIGSPFREDGDNSHIAEAAREVPDTSVETAHGEGDEGDHRKGDERQFPVEIEQPTEQADNAETLLDDRCDRARCRVGYATYVVRQP